MTVRVGCSVCVFATVLGNYLVNSHFHFGHPKSSAANPVGASD